MEDLQKLALHWASLQSGLVGFVLLAAGVFCAFQGFRFRRLMIGLVAGGAGLAIGAVASLHFNVPGEPVALGAGGVCLLMALVSDPLGRGIAATGLFGLLGQYLTQQFEVQQYTMNLVPIVFAGLGVAMVGLGPRTLPVVVTTLAGGIVMVLGFVATASHVFPSLAGTFLSFASDYAIVVPIMLVMLFVTGYSAQMNAKQGDMTTGSMSADDLAKPQPAARR